MDTAVVLSADTDLFRANESEQLFRDACCGRFLPANCFLTHEIVAKTTLGIEQREKPKWG